MAKIRPLSDELQKIAIEELNEVPDRRETDIEVLRTWIGQQPHLRARTDDQFLLSFLRGCKFSLEKTKSKIDRYYSLRTKYPDFYTLQNVDDPRLVDLLRYGVGLHLPTPLNGNGPRILLIRTGVYPVEKCSFVDVMCMAHGLEVITLMQDDYANVNGVLTVLDMSQLSGAHMLQMTPTVAKKMGIYAEEALPLRQKGTHIIYTPKAFEPLFNTFKPLLPAKQQQRLFVHGNKMESLYQHVPQKYLPKEYGGENGSVDEIIEENIKVFHQYREFLLDESKYGVDEKLRPGKPMDYDNIFGIDGSFRQLNVD